MSRFWFIFFIKGVFKSSAYSEGVTVFFKKNLGKYGFEGSKRNVVEGEDVLDFWVVDMREGERV